MVAPLFFDIMKALRNPTRYRIIQLLQEVLHPTEIAKDLNISRIAVDKHIKTLKAAQLVEQHIQRFPTLKYVYQLSDDASKLLDEIHVAYEAYRLSLKLKTENRLEDLEDAFLKGQIASYDYQQQKKQIVDIMNRID